MSRTPRFPPVLAVALLVSATAQAQDSLPAFPGAVGFGSTASGGRGGDVYHVTSLADDGTPGTLRHGITSADGPRTIVFGVGGIIMLGSSLDITADRLTIAGQTAPGGGITVAGYNTRVVRSTDVVVRFLRCRTGDFNAQFPGKGEDGLGFPGVGNGNADLIGDRGDGLSVTRSDRVIIDHCSASWSMDETMSVTVAKNITIQHCMISESLNDSYHHTGSHGLGSLVRGDVSRGDRNEGMGGYTFFGNLWAHHTARNPGAGTQQTLEEGQLEEDRRQIDLDFSNNVVYDWRSLSGHTLGSPTSAFPGRINVVRNYHAAGPSTSASVQNEVFRTAANFQLFQSENLIDSDKDDVEDAVIAGAEAFARAPSLVDSPFDFPPVEPIPADQAYQRVIVHAGASLPRDEIDARVVRQVQTRTGGIIDSQSEVGGLVPIAGGLAPVDTDRDGMSDEFETANTLNPADPADRNGTELSAEGYTNLEVYLSSLAEIVFEPTVARFESPPDATPGAEVSFDGSASSTAAGREVVSYDWDFGDGNTASGVQVTHTYPRIGAFRVTLRVTDDRGLVSTVSQSVQVAFADPDLEPWAEVNIGDPANPGFGGFVEGELEVFSDGTGLSGPSRDQVYLVYQELAGDFALVVRVAEVLRSGNNVPYVGLTIRESLEPSSRHLSVVIRREVIHGVLTIGRRVITRTMSFNLPHRWLRLERRGGELIAYTSSDGENWQERERREVDLPATVFGGVVAAAAAEGEFVVASLAGLTVEAIAPEFRRGDSNLDGQVDISDPIWTLERFLQPVALPCEDAADANDDGVLDISDAIATLDTLFLGTGLLPAPGSLVCGADPSEDGLPSCEYRPELCD